MQVIEYVIKDEDESGVYAISLVGEGAIESDFVMLSKNDVQMKLVDESKRLLMGAALIPDKQIFRKGTLGNEDYYIWFSADTIRKTSEKFLSQGYQDQTTLEHREDLKGNVVVESWIKEDEVHDKSVKYGLDAPIGSWIISMKIQDDEVLELAKQGIINGFSIEGMFSDDVEASIVEEIEQLLNQYINEK